MHANTWWWSIREIPIPERKCCDCGLRVEYKRLTSLKVEAGTGLRGPGMEPVGAAEQTGVAACRGELGCGHPVGKVGAEIPWEAVCVERGGPDWCGGEGGWQLTAGAEAGAVESEEVLGVWALIWTEDVESEESGAVVEVWEKESGWLVLSAVGRHVLLPALKSWCCCRSATFCADSWSWTYITWAPTPRLMVRGERPDRKSLICQDQKQIHLQSLRRHSWLIWRHLWLLW